MNIQIQSIQLHRHGICGAPFHAVLFRDPDAGDMLGVVFDAGHHVTVFHRDELAAGNIAFGVNSWRGDRYEPHLRTAIAAISDIDCGAAGTDPSDRRERAVMPRQVAIYWNIEDVQMIRPDLDDEQASTVLLQAEHHHDAGVGINWDVLETMAEDLYPKPSEPVPPTLAEGRP